MNDQLYRLDSKTAKNNEVEASFDTSTSIIFAWNLN